jgi:UDP-N-acetylglucosamine:LPS N-acetylglucosamine transferase
VGAGHDGAAAELARRLHAGGFEVERHDFLDLIPGPIGPALRQLYHLELVAAPGSWQWQFDVAERRPALADRINIFSTLARRQTARLLSRGVAAIVSTYPLASQTLGCLRRSGELEVPVATFLTDMSVHRIWVADGIDAHLAIHPVPAAQAEGLGARQVRVTAPAVSPRFRPLVSAEEQWQARVQFGLPHGVALALVAAGSWGVGQIAQTALDIAATGLAVPVVACGQNARLRRKLSSSGVGVALGWVADMPALLRACDVVVQNAGGLTSLEALATGVPVVTYRCLPGHGQANAGALHSAGWAPWIQAEQQLAPVLRDCLTSAARHRAAAFTRQIGQATTTGADPASVIAALAGQPRPATPIPPGHLVAPSQRATSADPLDLVRHSDATPTEVIA